MKKRTYNNPVGVGKYTGLLLITPFIAGFLLFTLYPFAASFLLGLTDYDGVHPPQFIGFENYRELLADSELHDSVLVTLKYTLILVPLKLIISLLAAMLLNLEVRGIGIYRTAFYVPSILGANLAVVIMWQFLFTSGGLVNQLIVLTGADAVSWYGDSRYALFTIILLRLWEFGSAMVLFLNALRDVPKEYYDAAKVDGCGGVRSFFAITIPMLKNVIFLNLVLQTIAAMQEFNAPYMLTGGGPMRSTYTIGMMIYNEMFRYHDAGTANAVSWLLFLFITAAVLILFRFTGRNREDSI
ncbi:MAG TPA: sugar ABC transporter permease [Ruminococcus flavefaciens]|nr:sugar ABC transporter permease [Ruminococcus flavefaciens]